MPSIEEKRWEMQKKINELQIQLDAYKEKLLKLNSIKPIINRRYYWNSEKRCLESKFLFYCGYCGEPVRRGTKRHKCGQVIDWNIDIGNT